MLAAGIALTLAYESIRSTGVVTTGGILFIMAGVLNVLVFEGERRRDNQRHGLLSSTFNRITSAAAVILGACMLIFNGTFVPLVPVMFGILVGITALYQFYLLAIGTRPVMMPGWLYAVPIALSCGAVYIFMQSPDIDDSRIILATGISMAVFGLGELGEGIILGNEQRKALKEAKNAGTDNQPNHGAAEPAIVPNEPTPPDTPNQSVQ